MDLIIIVSVIFLTSIRLQLLRLNELNRLRNDPLKGLRFNRHNHRWK